MDPEVLKALGISEAEVDSSGGQEVWRNKADGEKVDASADMFELLGLSGADSHGDEAWMKKADGEKQGAAEASDDSDMMALLGLDGSEGAGGGDEAWMKKASSEERDVPAVDEGPQRSASMVESDIMAMLGVEGLGGLQEDEAWMKKANTESD